MKTSDFALSQKDESHFCLSFLEYTRNFKFLKMSLKINLRDGVVMIFDI